MDITVKGIDDLYARYEHVLLRRDQVEKEQCGILTAYTKEFADDIVAVFEEKIACIELKKSIALCQQYINRGEAINIEELAAEIELIMTGYRQELGEMIREAEGAKAAKVASLYDVEESKKISVMIFLVDF